MTESNNFAVILKCILARKNISQGELASKIGLSNATITHYITGRSTPTHRSLLKIADCLGVSPQVFYMDADDCMSQIGNTKENFVSALNRLIDERNVSQSQIAKAIGVSRQAISLYVNGTQFPTEKILQAIADYFGLTVEDLTDDKSENTSEMVMCVKKMPKAYDECIFRDKNYIGQCTFGGKCDLCNGKCSYLYEMKEG